MFSKDKKYLQFKVNGCICHKDEENGFDAELSSGLNQQNYHI